MNVCVRVRVVFVVCECESAAPIRDDTTLPVCLMPCALCLVPYALCLMPYVGAYST